MNGAVEHYKACRKHGINPVIGLEAYFVDDRKTEAVRYERNHLTLLAGSDQGFKNLVKLSSAGYLEGYRRGKANVDLELLSRHSEGVIALTGCLQSRFCRRLVEENPVEARAHADQLLQVFGPDNVFFEVQKNGIAEQDKANEGIVKIAREVGRPLVATGDVHYLGREDFDNHRALLCVQTKSTLAQPKLSFDTNEFFLKSSDEMAKDFAQWPEALQSTLDLAERCQVELELGKMLIPRFPTPDGSAESDYLRRLAHAGLRLRYGDPAPAEAMERLELELTTVEKMGFSAYFLIVWDFVKFAKDSGIAVGPGRGSAAGSLVSYCLNITEVDPLAYGLLFERFLNPERVSMPDIDIDFSVKGRARVMRYVEDKYGKESVAQIVTFGKMLPRNATRDAARVLGLDYGAGDRLAKLIPEPVMGRSLSFERYLAEEPELRRVYDSEPEARQIIETAKGLEGIVRNAGIHAAAVVIADRPLTDIVPVQLMEDRGIASPAGERTYKVVTQYSMKPIEEIGLLKMDFLGLRNLDVIEDCLVIIEESTGVRPDMATLPLDDAADLRDDGPRRFDRGVPVRVRRHARGPAQGQADRVRGPCGAERPLPPGGHAPHRHLRAQQAQPGRRVLHRRSPAPDHRGHLLGDPLPGAVDADRQVGGGLLRRRGRRPAQGHRQEEPRGHGRAARALLRGRARHRHQRARDQRPLGGQRGRGRLLLQPLPRRLLRADLLPHRLAQGQLPGRVHGRADLLGHVDQGQGAVLRGPVRGHGHRGAAARRERVGPRLQGRRGQHPLRARRGQGPRLRGRGGDHPGAREGRAVRLDLGLLPARRLPGGEQARRRLAREVRRVRLAARHPHRRDAGADRRPRPRARRASRTPSSARARSSTSAVATTAPAPPTRTCPIPPLENDRKQLNEWEKETLGLFLSSHPLKEVRHALRAKVDCSVADLAQKKDGEWVTVGGMIAECKRIRTKKGDPMMFATLDDLEGQTEMLVFNSSYAANADKVDVDKIVIVRGRVDHKEAGETKLVAQEVTPFEPTEDEVDTSDRGGGPRARGGAADPSRLTRRARGFLEELKEVVGHHPGDHELLLAVGERRLILGGEFRVSASSACRSELSGLHGASRVAAA